LATLHSIQQGFVQLGHRYPNLRLQIVEEDGTRRFQLYGSNESAAEVRFAALCIRLWKSARHLIREEGRPPLVAGTSDVERVYQMLFTVFENDLFTQPDWREDRYLVVLSPTLPGTVMLEHVADRVVGLLDRLIADAESAPGPDEELWTIREAAEQTGVSDRMFQRWVKEGKLSMIGDARLLRACDVRQKLPSLLRRHPRTKARAIPRHKAT